MTHLTAYLEELIISDAYSQKVESLKDRYVLIEEKVVIF